MKRPVRPVLAKSSVIGPHEHKDEGIGRGQRRVGWLPSTQ